MVSDDEVCEPEGSVCVVGEPARLITELAIGAGLCKIAGVDKDVPHREVGLWGLGYGICNLCGCGR